jgi:hypothetical protein
VVHLLIADLAINLSLMKTCKPAFVIALIIATGIMVYSVKKTRLGKRLVSASDAGYETAYDILFPLKKQRLKKR